MLRKRSRANAFDVAGLAQAIERETARTAESRELLEGVDASLKSNRMLSSDPNIPSVPWELPITSTERMTCVSRRWETTCLPL